MSTQIPQASSAYDLLCSHARESALLRSIEGLLTWDERTKMPSAAGPYRAEQITHLSGLIHKQQTDARVGEWLAELADSPLAADPHSDAGATIRGLKRSYQKKVKLPQSLVEELARTSVLGQQAWVEARANNDFATFQPLLEKIYQLKRQEADAVGYTDCPYDALLDDYEPEEKTANIRRVLAALRDELVPLVAAIQDSGRAAQLDCLHRNYPAAAQEKLGTLAATQIGFEFERGRLDVTHHPFCGGAGPDDIRMTTRYDEQFFNSGFFSILHEAGHGIYEQGLPGQWFGLPLGEAISLGIHESQSRMWENLVGRSRSYWNYFYPQVRQICTSLAGVPLDEFYFAINDVRPSLIRVEADEATYNLHILIRFELEQALLHDELKVADLPAAWNEKYRDYLGIVSPTDADGVLQDVHWSAGLVGYFPTYSLGNLYASQFFEQANADLAAAGLGTLDEQFARGDFLSLRNWLREHIHRAGQRYTATELVERVTGQPLSHAPLIRHLRGKFGSLYGLT